MPVNAKKPPAEKPPKPKAPPAGHPAPKAPSELSPTHARTAITKLKKKAAALSPVEEAAFLSLADDAQCAHYGTKTRGKAAFEE